MKSPPVEAACSARINTAALRHNYARLQKMAKGVKVLALLKANAYGHGLLNVARALPDADAFGVARLEEAVWLREAGIEQRIVILGGVHTPYEWRVVDRMQLDVVIHQLSQLQACEDFCSGLNDSQQCGFAVWLKFDSGMHRLGLDLSVLQNVKARVNQLQKFFSKPVIVMSHLANADDSQDPFNQAQAHAFDSIRQAFLQDSGSQDYQFSLQNSGSLLAGADISEDWVRPGIALFGIAPFEQQTGREFDLKPVMSLESRLIAIKTVKASEAVGYRQNWRAEKDTRIGIASIGYGDGYPWQASNGTPVMVDGVECQLVGRVSMDLITIDLTNQPQARLQSRVQLWGDELAVETVAECAQTIPYTLVCGITQRVANEVV
ncbi:MAG: alanine racemase [Gammaproteobacteria bacterium]|nr:alanine racemase [Gammaproteobacteria bacterium]NNM13084.1 alanine racemase [Gammaproteobacteria bacterium]